MSTQFLLTRLSGALGVGVIGAVAENSGLRAPMLCCAGVAFFVWVLTFRARARIVSAFGVRRA
jgi:hypothetical protein